MCARVLDFNSRKNEIFLLFFNFIYSIFQDREKMHYIYLCIESLSQIWDEVGFGSKRPFFSRLYRRHSIYSCVVHLSRFYVRFFSLVLSLSVIGPKFWQLWTRERICFFVVIFRRMRRVYKRRRRRRRGEERTIIDPVNMCAADTIRERKKRKTHSHA